VESFGAVRSVLSILGAYGIVSCSFPDYTVDDGPTGLARICSDDKLSEAETDVDCGGGCPPCQMGRRCRVAADCASGSCIAGRCQMPTCSDGVKNATESDVDCGGACAPCRAGRDCHVAEDCADHVCDAPECEGEDCVPFCQVATCDDGAQNGDETGPDCGSGCQACDNGVGCRKDADCVSDHCVEDLCVAPGCTDELLNGNETDTDCGGTECKPCEPGRACSRGEDCVSRICEDASCTAEGCEDGVQNRDESDIDCGGGNCDGCGELGRCVDGTDCASGVCLTGYCVPKNKTDETLSRDGWSASASNSYPDHNPNQVLDSVGGRWTSNANQYVGMWFEVDMGQLRTFFEIDFTSTESPKDAPGEYRIWLATEAGKYTVPAGPNHFGGPVSVYAFETARIARYIKIEVMVDKQFWWSINEIIVKK
jgi:hypothetical protein